MGISEYQFNEMLRRTESNRHRESAAAQGVELEVPGVHEPIIRWCEEQVPMVPYIHSRTDKRSHIAKGAPDFTVLYHGHVIFIEAKSKDGKLSKEQVVWKVLARHQGIEVHICRSFDDFMDIVRAIKKENPDWKSPAGDSLRVD